MSHLQAQTGRAETSQRSGFTLLEVVLALGLLLIGLSTILGLFSFGAALSRSSLLATEAAGAVEAVIADLENSFFPLREDGSAGPPEGFEGRPVPGHSDLVYGARPTPNPDRLGPDGEPIEYRVDVEISWSSRGAKRSKKLSTVLLREVPFGERMRRQFVEGDESATAGSSTAPGAGPRTSATRPPGSP